VPAQWKDFYSVNTEFFQNIGSPGGASPLRLKKPLVSEAIDQESFTTTRGPHAFLSCRAAAVVPDPHFRVRDHPPPPQVDRFAVAEAEPRSAGHARACLPAQGRDVRRARGRVPANLSGSRCGPGHQGAAPAALGRTCFWIAMARSALGSILRGTSRDRT